MAFADDVFVVVLAGGSGTRFWPKSRHLTPKQLMRLGGSPETMLETTLARIDADVPPARRFIVTHKDQAAATRAIVKDRATVIAEPEARNTANALAVAALEIQKRAPRGVMLSFHADHLIQDLTAFRAALEAATAVARRELLALIAVQPESPDTGFGYIERGAPLAEVPGAFQVKSFREKPDLETAKSYVASGRFAWNAGLFVWRVDTLLAALDKALPPSIAALRGYVATHGSFATLSKNALEALAAVYQTLPKISIDHAVLEVATNVAMVEARLGWQDVGSWSALDKAFPPDADGNLVFGDGCLIGSKGTTVDSDGPFVAGIGLEDMVVVAHKGAILVCPKRRDQDVKDVVQWLKDRGRKELV